MRSPFVLGPAVAAGLLACSPPQGGVPERFGTSGELVAMSGAGAGAGNACFTCHGLDGGGDGAGVPRLAGLDPGYLQHQLEAYADGRRTDPSMRRIATELSARERLLVSRFYAGMPAPAGGGGEARRAPRLFLAGDPDRNLPACAACHGPGGLGLGAGIPPLAGQPAPYLAQQLENWRRGTRRSDPGNVMQEIARALTPSEVAALASYASAFPLHPRSRESAGASPEGRRSGPRNDASALPRRVAGS